jgi:hypothetical protein
MNKTIVRNIFNSFEISKACEYKIEDKKNELEINY